MEEIFVKLEGDSRVHVNGAHHASMINAYGCVAKDLERAIARFESIRPSHANPMSPNAPLLPDVLCYEALFLVFVAHKRPDLVLTYLQRFKASHLQMTPYVANLVIKALAAAGDLDGARNMFESMEDPPSGHASAGKIGARHSVDGAEAYTGVSPAGHVYREVSE